MADEWVTQLLRQGDAKVFKKYSQMKLQMKREALQKLNRTRIWFWSFWLLLDKTETIANGGSGLESKEHYMSGRSAAW